jgi:hypothetical protein
MLLKKEVFSPISPAKSEKFSHTVFSNLSKNWTSYSKFIISLVALSYLTFIPVKGIEQNRRLGITEVGILVIVLIFNSPLLDKLEKLQFGKDGIEFQLFDSKVKANVEANQKESRALSLLGTLIEDTETQRKFFDYLLDDGERDTLEKLFEAEKNNKQYLYIKKEEFTQFLQHLRVLGFIESQANYSIQDLPAQGDLREYFKVTCIGKICLALGSSKISPEDIVNEATTDRHSYEILTKIIGKQSDSQTSKVHP